MPKIILLFIFFASSILIASCTSELISDKNSWKLIDNLGYQSISELEKDKDHYEKVIETEGYVIDSFYCQCPGNANCTCPPSKITVSQNQDSKDKEQIIQILTHTQGFLPNQKYGFIIEISERGSDSQNTPHYSLIAYRKK